MYVSCICLPNAIPVDQDCSCQACSYAYVNIMAKTGVRQLHQPQFSLPIANQKITKKTKGESDGNIGSSFHRQNNVAGLS